MLCHGSGMPALALEVLHGGIWADSFGIFVFVRSCICVFV